jgi:cell wall-associated NlpC family hydrolase
MKSTILIAFLFIACAQNKSEDELVISNRDSAVSTEDTAMEVVQQASYSQQEKVIHTGDVTPEALLSYAKTLIGTPYKYGATDPKIGFDCSGFITHIFNHFGINVPRSSIDFTNVKREIDAEHSAAGDIVLFTGTDSTITDVGHMGIVTSNENGVINFIHSTSGKANGVTITPMNKYYLKRFVKIIRIFPQND